MIGLDMEIEDPDALGKRLAATRGPIVVGPWLSEIGFEVLYWIPFLRWMTSTYQLDPARLWVVSRGGCDAWYADLAGHYLDIFDWYSPRAFRSQNEQRLSSRHPGFPRTNSKQYCVTQFDLSIMAKVAWYLRGKTPQLLHPAHMYSWFRKNWSTKRSTRIDDYARVRPWKKPESPLIWPRPYVAMKFYTSSTSPATAAYLEHIDGIIQLVAETHDVLLLHDETRYDDHGVAAVPTHPRVHVVPLTPRTNLAQQTAVIAHAERFIGTYGGFAYLAPMLRVPTLGIYAQVGFRQAHLERMQRACRQTLRVAFDVLPSAEAVAHLRERAYAA